MILPTGNRRNETPGGRQSAVTLIELLLVMALLIIVVSVSVPSLASFFRGRTLDYEGRRLLSLTRHGQSRAVSEGVPMLLWFDASGKTYGLEEEPGYVEKDPKAVRFNLDPELQMEVVRDERSRLADAGSARMGQVMPQAESTRKGLPEIRFMPDGFTSWESPEAIRIWDRTGASLWLARTTNRMSYELKHEFTRQP